MNITSQLCPIHISLSVAVFSPPAKVKRRRGNPRKPRFRFTIGGGYGYTSATYTLIETRSCVLRYIDTIIRNWIPMLELSCVFLSWFLVFRVAICVMFLSCLVKIVVEGGEDC